MFKFALLTFVVLLLHVGAWADLEEVPAGDVIYDSYRLPTAVTPVKYKLEVITHLNDTEGFIFRGVVWITMNVNAFADNITLHTKNLTISTEQIMLYELAENSSVDSLQDESQDHSEEERKIRKFNFLPQNDYLIISPANILSKFRKYVVKIPFEGKLDTSLLGYYRSSYLDKASGKKIWLAVTQFEATHARQAFPCFDEPEMKATFDISIGHHKMYNSLSNTPQKGSKSLDKYEDFVIDTFETTVPMSTYLVAYCVSDFEYKESPNMKDDVKFRIYARRDAIDQVDYAAEIGPKVLKFYEDYFKIKFPMPKIDMIAIPDFGAGAMENWGLITYRETALLYQANASTLAAKHRVAEVIAHELAHQWFGNLVTMQWWTDLWLNEGFATYVASLGVAELHPEWESLNEESVDNTLDIFKFDSLKASHPVSVSIGHPNQISQIFDAISYSKGSVIIRMMHKFLGEETFQNGVSKYLKKHEYANAKQDDLWAALTEVAHSNQALPSSLTVKDIMDTWTLQVGFPIVHVERNYDTNSAELTQVRYLSDRFKTRDETSSFCWWIPLSYTTSEKKDFNASEARDWMRCSKDKKPEEKKIENLPDKSQWVIFNIQLAGLYKIKYDRHNYKLIVKTLNSDQFQSIHIINRAQLIDDAMDLAWTGEQDYGVALAMINYLSQEEDYIPWKSALDNLRSVNRLLIRSPLYGVFKSYIQHILEPIYDKVGKIDQPVESSRLDAVKRQSMICGWACRFGVGNCVEKSVEVFARWMEETDPDQINPVPLNLRPIIYCTAIRFGREAEWSFLWKRYINSNVGAEKSMIIGSLSCSREQWLLSRYLDWSLNSTLVRKQDATFVFGGVVGEEIGFHLARNFFYERIDDIHQTLYPDTSRLSRYIKPLAQQMSSLKELTELKDLIAAKPKEFEKATQGVKQALETVELNNQWKISMYMDLSRRLNNMMARNFNFDLASFEDEEDDEQEKKTI